MAFGAHDAPASHVPGAQGNEQSPCERFWFPCSSALCIGMPCMSDMSALDAVAADIAPDSIPHA